MTTAPPYFDRPAAAYVRGMLGTELAHGPESRLFLEPLPSLRAEDLERLIMIGRAHGLRLHRFKRTMGLARVKAVLGALKSLQPSSLLDVGTGRGAFLWPLLDEFPDLPVTANDQLDYRVKDLEAVRRGGMTNLNAVRADATSLPFGAGAFDVVTLLEVLEHIPDAQAALAEVCRVCSRAVALSVPSRPDDNPGHLHLFNEWLLRDLFIRNGLGKVHFRHVLNHLLAVGVKSVP